MGSAVHALYPTYFGVQPISHLNRCRYVRNQQVSKGKQLPFRLQSRPQTTTARAATPTTTRTRTEIVALFRNSPCRSTSQWALTALSSDENSDVSNKDNNNSDSVVDHNKINSNRTSAAHMESSSIFAALDDSTVTYTVINTNDDDDANGSTSSNDLNTPKIPSPTELQLMRRVMQLEELVAAQQVQLGHLTEHIKTVVQSTAMFAEVIALFREAGLKQQPKQPISSVEAEVVTTGNATSKTTPLVKKSVIDDASSIFGTAPATVMDAADAAGASILAGILGGKQRMLVDVRDAELSFRSEHYETLVQFIELAILPVAAGLEGMRSRRNRLKVVFPTVSQLLMYRKSMALAAPEVVALSTLGFDPVERKDNLVVILVPSPDDEEGLLAMNELLESKLITQPVVVLNHHMVPVSGPAAGFEVAYHLRLLSVQYMTDNEAFTPEQYFTESGSSVSAIEQTSSSIIFADPSDDISFQAELTSDTTPSLASMIDANATETLLGENNNDTFLTNSAVELDELKMLDARDAALEAALIHAQQVGQNHGSTRAMVIRAYPRPWHVFVDTSPDTDADYEVAATFAEEPGLEQVNNAIVECLEGSELEDELVAQQMQQALELGQLDRISDMLSSMGFYDLDDEGDNDTEDDDDSDPYNDLFSEDTDTA